jgi:hypothetical protein
LLPETHDGTTSQFWFRVMAMRLSFHLKPSNNWSLRIKKVFMLFIICV